MPSPGDPQSLNRYAYVRNNPLKYTDPSGHALWAGDERDFGEMPPPSPSPALAPPEVYWGLLTYELGPRNEQGKSLINALFDPWPDLSEANDEVRSDFYHFKTTVLYDVYGGPEGLAQKVTDACASNRCNNSWLDTDLDTDYWSDFRSETRTFLAIHLIGKGQGSPLGYFLLEVKASPVNPANYEPWWLSEVMRTHPPQVLRAQGKWVLEVYLADREVWQQITRGGWGGWRLLSTDIPVPQ